MPNILICTTDISIVSILTDLVKEYKWPSRGHVLLHVGPIFSAPPGILPEAPRAPCYDQLQITKTFINYKAALIVHHPPYYIFTQECDGS